MTELEKRWKAAIEEARPLAEALLAIRNKYGIENIELEATKWASLDHAPYTEINIFNDPWDKREGVTRAAYYRDGEYRWTRWDENEKSENYIPEAEDETEVTNE